MDNLRNKSNMENYKIRSPESIAKIDEQTRLSFQTSIDICEDTIGVQERNMLNLSNPEYIRQTILEDLKGDNINEEELETMVKSIQDILESHITALSEEYEKYRNLLSLKNFGYNDDLVNLLATTQGADQIEFIETVNTILQEIYAFRKKMYETLNTYAIDFENTLKQSIKKLIKAHKTKKLESITHGGIKINKKL